MGDDSIELLLIPYTDLSLSLMVRPEVIHSSPTLSSKVSEELFTIKIQIKQKVLGAIFNIGWQKNLISVSLVKKLDLEMTSYPYL